MKKLIYKFIVLLVIISIFYYSFIYLDKKFIDQDNIINDYLIDRAFSNEYLYTIKDNKTSVVNKNSDTPLVYIYNTHQGEEYRANDEFGFYPNVSMVNYLLEDEFNKNGYLTLVEERSIKEIRDKNNWNYSECYKASRYYIDDVKSKYNSLKYFIDIHRDSLEHDRTFISIDGKDYASILFIVGLENDNYKDNLLFTEMIHNKINTLYPGLSKGILKKSGVGVNGVYNQDNSPYTILIEVGGVDSTTYEVMNTSLALSRSLLEVFNEIKDN